METFKTCTVAGMVHMDVLLYFKVVTNRRFLACLLNLGRQPTPRPRETCVSSSLGQAVPKLVNSQCKSLDRIQHHLDHMSTSYPSPHYYSLPHLFIFHSTLRFAFPI